MPMFSQKQNAKQQAESKKPKKTSRPCQTQHTVHPSLVLQRSIGNQTIQQMQLSEQSQTNNVLPSSGQPLDPVTRDHFEHRFGYDFSTVRVHTGERASTSALAMNADAYTVKNHIVLGTPYQPAHDGKAGHLLAHELTHVIQQGGSHTKQGETANNALQVDSVTQTPRVQRRLAGRLQSFLTSAEARVARLAQQTLPEGSHGALGVPIHVPHDVRPAGPVRILGVPFALYRSYYGFQLIYHSAADNQVVLDLRGTWYVLSEAVFLHLFDPERGELRPMYESVIPSPITREVETPGHLSSTQAERVRHAIDAIRLLPRWRREYGDPLETLRSQGRIFAGRQQAAVGRTVAPEPLVEWEPEWRPLSVSETSPAPTQPSTRQIQRGLTSEDAIIIDFEVVTADWRADQTSRTGVGATLVHEYEHMRRGLLHTEAAVEAVERQYFEDMNQLQNRLIEATRAQRAGVAPGTSGAWSRQLDGVSYTLHCYGPNRWFVTSP